MSDVDSLAIVGFSTFERATFDAFLKLASRRIPAYRLEQDNTAADFLLVDADDSAAVSRVQAPDLWSRCVMLGATVHHGVALQQSRPINLMLLVRALDALPRRARREPAPTSMPAILTPASGLAPSPSPAPAPAPAHHPTPTPAPTMQAMPSSKPVPQSTLSAPTTATAAKAAWRVASIPETVPDAMNALARDSLDHILVVDDSDIALRFMAANLSRFGFQVHLARSGEEALERLSQRTFDMVFLDVMMQGMDGFKTCKAIKRARYANGRQPPTVVMLTSRHTPVDKLRGTMAGCDAYLTKPLREAELLAVVGDREVKRHAYVETHNANSTLL